MPCAQLPVTQEQARRSLGNAGTIRLHAKCGFREVGISRDIGGEFGAPLDAVPLQRAPRAAENTASD